MVQDSLEMVPQSASGQNVVQLNQLHGVQITDNINDIPSVVKKDLLTINPKWSDLVEAEMDSSPVQQNSEGSFEMALSKSQKKKLRQNNIKLNKDVIHNTRARAVSLKPSQ